MLAWWSAIWRRRPDLRGFPFGRGRAIPPGNSSPLFSSLGIAGLMRTHAAASLRYLPWHASPSCIRAGSLQLGCSSLVCRLGSGSESPRSALRPLRPWPRGAEVPQARPTAARSPTPALLGGAKQGEPFAELQGIEFDPICHRAAPPRENASAAAQQRNSAANTVARGQRHAMSAARCGTGESSASCRYLRGEAVEQPCAEGNIRVFAQVGRELYADPAGAPRPRGTVLRPEDPVHERAGSGCSRCEKRARSQPSPHLLEMAISSTV